MSREYEMLVDAACYHALERANRTGKKVSVFYSPSTRRAYVRCDDDVLVLGVEPLPEDAQLQVEYTNG